MQLLRGYCGLFPYHGQLWLAGFLHSCLSYPCFAQADARLFGELAEVVLLHGFFHDLAVSVPGEVPFAFYG
mgnify:CR=1 FL=1